MKHGVVKPITGVKDYEALTGENSITYSSKTCVLLNHYCLLLVNTSECGENQKSYKQFPTVNQFWIQNLTLPTKRTSCANFANEELLATKYSIYIVKVSC